MDAEILTPNMEPTVADELAETTHPLATEQVAEFADDFMHRQWGILKGTALRHGFSPNDIDDLGQETFIRAARKVHTFEDQGKDILAWMRVVGANVMLDERQKTAKRKEVVSDPQEPTNLHRWDAPTDSAEATAFHTQEEPQQPDQAGRDNPKYSALYEAVDRLPKSQREATLAVTLGTITVAEYASQLGVKVDTVNSQLSRSRKRLGELLAPQYGKAVAE